MQSVSPRDHPCPDGGIGRRAGLKIQCPLKTCGFEPRSGHAKKTAASGLFWCPDGPYHPPPLRGCPQGGDWGKTPRPPPVTVFPLRWRYPVYRPSYLRSRAQMGPYTHAAEASFSSTQFPLPPAIFQGTVSDGVTKRVTARGILARVPCQFRLYKCLILKRFLSP